MSDKPTVLVALQGFVTEAYGERINVAQGDAFEAGHPAVKANPDLFGPLAFRHPIQGKVEQATAAPGERRGILSRKPKAKPEPQPEPEPAGKALTTSSLKGE